jgi:WD40 repeat protein
MLAASFFGGVRLFSSSDGKLVSEIPEATPPFAFSPDGEVIAVFTRKGIVLKEVKTTKTLCLLEQSEGIFADPRVRYMSVLAFSPDGASVIAARNTLREETIFALDVWSSATGNKGATLPVARDTVEHAGLISAIALAPGGQLLASGSHDHSLRLWDLGSRQCVERLFGNPSEVWAVAFSADGRGILSGAKDGTLRLWPTNTASREIFYTGNWNPVKFSKDGRLLAVIDNQSTFSLLNLRTGEPEQTVQLSKMPFGFWAGAVSDDMSFLVDRLPEGGLRVWNLSSRTAVDLKNPEITKAGWMRSSPDSKSAPLGKPWTAISPDNTALLSGGGRGPGLWWNLKDLSEPPERFEGRGALFSRNGGVLVTVHEQTVKVWITSSRSLRAEVPIETEMNVQSPLALSADGNLLAVGSNPVTETENAIRLWDTRNGKLIGVCKGHTQGVRWLAISPDAETLASVSDDSTLRFWNVRTRQELLSIWNLADPIREILFSPDGNTLAAKTSSGLRLLDASRAPERITQPSLKNDMAGE